MGVEKYKELLNKAYKKIKIGCAMKIFVYFMANADENGLIDKRQMEIAEEMGLVRQQVIDAVKVLIKVDLIEVIKKGQLNVYKIK